MLLTGCPDTTSTPPRFVVTLTALSTADAPADGDEDDHDSGLVHPALGENKRPLAGHIKCTARLYLLCVIVLYHTLTDRVLCCQITWYALWNKVPFTVAKLHSVSHRTDHSLLPGYIVCAIVLIILCCQATLCAPLC